MDEEILKKVVSDVFDDKFKNFYIEPERHYQEHLWLSNLICWSEKAKSSIMKTVIGIVITGILGLLVVGFALFYKGE